VSCKGIYIVLGCFGRTDDDFVSCSGIENRILLVDESLYFFEEIMNYIDRCQLFDKVMLEYNAIRHFIHNMYDNFDQPFRKLWSEKQYRLYQKFVIDHRDCGLFIRLDFADKTS
jgi:hypothetical protein